MINLYQNITPNHTSTHYLFSTFSTYLTFLNTYKLKEITPSNYTINNLYLRVKIDETLTLANYKNVTYIVNTNDELCYLVNSAKVQSGYVYFYISVDNWGTYLHKASLKDILIKRTNRKLSDNGIYDIITTTKDLEVTKLPSESEYVGLVIHLTAKYNDDVTVSLSLFKPFDSHSILDLSGNFNNLSQLTKVEWIINGQTIEYTGLTIKSVYAVPNTIAQQFYNEYISTDYYRLKHQDGTILYDGLTKFKGGIHDNYYYALTLTYNTDLNKRVLIGSMGGNINEIKKTKTTQDITYYYMFTYYEVKLYVSNGTSQQDISQSILVPLVQRDNVSAVTEISTTLRYIMGVTQIATGFLGNPLAITKGLSTIGSTYERQINAEREKNNPINTSLISSGNALISYKNSMLNFSSPYCIFSFTSINDEEKHARKLGATFNEYVTTLTELFTKDFLGTGASTDDTFIQADIEISNIPLDAINDITGKFNNGVNTQLL